MKLNIEWIQMEIEEWVSKKICDTFWIIKTNQGCETGYFDKFDKLSDEEADHFLTYRNCYYLKGEPCERDEEGLCYCILQEQNGNCVIDSISQGKNIENMLYIRKNLLNKIKILKKSNIYHNCSMNGINFG
tara:strand:- start:6395 stop:6787 length:393 start_codon:yes stop_codon:yes gene_type:complete